MKVENPPDPPECYKGRSPSPYDNLQPLNHSSQSRKSSPRKRPSTLPLFIGSHTNIDDLLGLPVPHHSPIMSRVGKQKIEGLYLFFISDFHQRKLYTSITLTTYSSITITTHCNRFSKTGNYTWIIAEL